MVPSLVKWHLVLYLDDLDIGIVYKPERGHLNVDPLSRVDRYTSGGWKEAIVAWSCFFVL